MLYTIRTKGRDLKFKVYNTTGVSDADPCCTGMSLTVAQNDGFCAQGFLF